MALGLTRKNRLVGNRYLNTSLRTVIVGLSALTAAGIFYAYSSVQALNTSYEASQALEVQRELMETSRRLKMELNNLRSMERLERQAIILGLLKPSPQQVRKLP